MSEIGTKTHGDFVLPSAIVSKTDISHLLQEIERVDNELTANAVRAKIGTDGISEPPMSAELSDFLQQNELSLENSHERSEIVKQLASLKDNAPIVHMTFAVVADPESLQQLAQWLRATVHPQAVISVGLQPGLVAGVYLRTPNRIHDLSMRALIKGQREALVKQLETFRGSR